MNCSDQNKLNLHLKNSSGNDFSEVKLIYNGDDIEVGSLTNQQQVTKALLPRGDSGLKIQLTNPQRETITREVNVYFEPGFKGEIQVEILNDLTLRHSDNIQIP